MKKALLFINGEPPKDFPNLEDYDLIGCTDGAFHYLKEKNFPFVKLDFVSGDFDDERLYEVIEEYELFLQTLNDYNLKFNIIETPNQNKTDFEKALEIIHKKGFEIVDVYGASGGEQDHFLGNLSVAFFFKDLLDITFFDKFSKYFFIPKKFSISGTKGRMISLYPFPTAENIITKGLVWQLNNESLSMLSRIGTRNFAEEDTVSVNFEKGDLLIFIGQNI